MWKPPDRPPQPQRPSAFAYAAPPQVVLAVEHMIPCVILKEGSDKDKYQVNRGFQVIQ